METTFVLQQNFYKNLHGHRSVKCPCNIFLTKLNFHFIKKKVFIQSIYIYIYNYIFLNMYQGGPEILLMQSQRALFPVYLLLTPKTN